MYTFAIASPNSDDIDNQPEGSGYVTFTIAGRGSVSYKGVLADGTLFSGASAIVAYTCLKQQKRRTDNRRLFRSQFQTCFNGASLLHHQTTCGYAMP